jgi:flagellar motor switch protein FliM
MDATNELSETQQVLSQSEVERLLAQVAEQDASVVVQKDGGEVERRSKDTIQPYDFRNPVFLSPSELRKLRLRHEEFIRSLAARLSIYLRLDFSIQMSKLQTLPYQKFTESLANPSFITLFKVEPLRGICALEVQPRLGLTIVDRLLGGPAHSVNPDHDLTEIELALLQQAVQVILSEWCLHWSNVQELRPVVLGHESNGRFLQTAAHDTVILAIAMEARVGDCMEQLQIGFPYYTLEPLIRQLGQAVETTAKDRGRPSDTLSRWNPLFEEVRVPVTAEWPGLELSARELTQLKAGDVLQLSSECSQRVRIRLADIPKFHGRLGTRAGQWAVELTGVLNEQT